MRRATRETGAWAIRDVTIADGGLLAALHGPAFPDEPWDVRAMAEVLAMPGACGFLAFDPDRPAPLGFIAALDLGGECEVLALAVAASCRRRGVGRALLRRLLLHARGRPVLLDVAEDNLAAITLYGDAGFVVAGRRPGYYRRRDAPAAASLTMRFPATP